MVSLLFAPEKNTAFKFLSSTADTLPPSAAVADRFEQEAQMSAFKTVQQVRREIRQQVLAHLQHRQIPFTLVKQSVCLTTGRLDFNSAELTVHPAGKVSRSLPYRKVRFSQLAALLQAQPAQLT